MLGQQVRCNRQSIESRQSRAGRLFVLTAVAAALLAYSSAHAQISPGPLSRAHAHLDGPAHCTDCHKIGAGEKAFQCLSCHQEIATRLSAGRGFHSVVLGRDSSAQQCARCHSEHNGSSFTLIRWEPSLQQFDHAKTGYKLEGKHAGIACASCHNAQHISASEKLQIQVRDLSRTYLGVDRQCSTCHRDAHNGQLGANCQGCHNPAGWKGVTNFDHRKTRFPLTGAHLQTACEKCHRPTGPEHVVKFAGLPFERCSSCHSDPHKNAFAAPCESCHNTSSWHAVSATILATRFDHGRTKFSLLGKHSDLRCTQCHSGGDFRKPIAFQKCSDCHRPDPHGGQFLKRADAGECSSCHTVDGFKPAKFGLLEHAQTRYPLEAKHALVACAKCHVPAGKATVFKIKFDRCANCHRDRHEGQFAAAPYLNQCERCHTLQGYRPSTFTVAKHKQTAFPLAGAHLAVACGDCHKTSAEGRFKTIAQFRFADQSCTACHQDPHRGQFRVVMAAGKMRAGSCEACHTVSSWKGAAGFDHSSTAFPLTGAHKTVSCTDCHRPSKLRLKLADVDFHSAPKNCEACHAEVHGGQFADAAKVTQCASCHNTYRWKPAPFDHNTRTAFPLQGAHNNVACNRCHTRLVTIEGKQVLFYKPTPKECSACHGAEVRNAQKP